MDKRNQEELKWHYLDSRKTFCCKMVESEVAREPRADCSVFPEPLTKGGGGAKDTHSFHSRFTESSKVTDCTLSLVFRKILLPKVVTATTANNHQAHNLLNYLQPYELGITATLHMR